MKIGSRYIGELGLERIDTIIGADEGTITSQIAITTSLAAPDP